MNIDKLAERALNKWLMEEGRDSFYEGYRRGLQDGFLEGALFERQHNNAVQPRYPQKGKSQ